MADLFFPQLTSGAVAQYPVQKLRSYRSIKNVLPDGRMILLPDTGAGSILWTLSYVQLSAADIDALQAFFIACKGALRSFTFLDPTENLLASSADLTNSVWQNPFGLTIRTGVADPNGGNSAWSITNSGQQAVSLSQTLAIPAYYQYCLSAYMRSATANAAQLFRTGASQSTTDPVPLSTSWSQVQTSGTLGDRTNQLTVGITIPAGQSVETYGLQLEPQAERTDGLYGSRYGGVYRAYWAQQEFVSEAQGPDSFATTIKVEASV